MVTTVPSENPESARHPVRVHDGKGSDAVAKALITGLYEGRFTPGQRLVEPDLISAFQVSRSTVREALAKLSSQGIVVVSPFKGASVHRLSRKEAEEILAMLEVLIAFACGLAAGRIAASGAEAPAPKDFRQLLGDVMDHESRGDSIVFQKARNLFFRQLVELTDNGKLRDTLRGLNIHLLRVQMRHYDVEGHKERFEDYRAMGECVLAGNVEAAEQAGRHYIRRVAEAVRRIPDRMFAP